MSFKVVLYQPEIPANTGNIGRLCLGANAELHIIKPMRFLLTDAHLKRAGMDYFKHVKLFKHDSLEDLFAAYPESTAYYLTTKTDKKYTDMKFKDGDMLIFGPESRGIPEEILNNNKNNCLTIPMHTTIRSHNLANSVAIVLFEALRQTNFNY